MVSLSYAVIGDLHLAHNKTPTAWIIENLKTWLKPMFKRIDVLFFTGDVFDKLISYPSKDAIQITTFIRWLTYMCELNNIVLRVLEGTRSHDWKQSHMFETIKSKADIKWVSEVSIEYIPVLDMNVLFIPDEANRWCKDTLEQVRDLMVDNNLKTVDLAMMHGIFHYQLTILPDTHDQEAYETLVKHFVYIGHYHTSVTNGKIRPPGSFDRLAHNEEEQKGAWLCTYEDGKVSNEFVINRNAYPYVTVDIGELDMKQSLRKIQNTISGLKNGRVRIRAPDGNPILDNLVQLKLQYPSVVIEPYRVRRKHEKVEFVGDYKATAITKKNVVETMENYLRKTDQYDEEVITRLKKYVKEKK